MRNFISTRWAWAALLGATLALEPSVSTRDPAPALAVTPQLSPATQGERPLPPADDGRSVQSARAPSLYAVESAVHKARAGGAPENEIYRIRAAALSTQTIAMLTEREQAEQQWMRRIDAWRAERALLAPADGAALQALRERLFSAEEFSRLDSDEQARAVQPILR